MREITFVVPGNPDLTIRAMEQENGTILFELVTSGEEHADIRGLFFNLRDTSFMGDLSISGDDVNNHDFGNVSNFKNGNNVKGGGRSPYDVGVDFGTPGIGKDDIGSTSFVLSSSDGNLTLDIIAQVEFAARMTSTGISDSGRNGSQKTSVISPAAPDAIDDVADTLEDTPITVDVVSNDTDEDGDSLTIIEVGAADNGTLEIINNEIRYTSNEHWSGTDSFTYTVYDGDGGYDTATATINVEAVADAPELSLNVRSGENVNEIIVDISSALVDTDGSESYILTFAGLPEGAVIQGANGNQILNPTGQDIITLLLEEGVDFDFDLEVSATSTEESNNDQATSVESVAVTLDFNETSQDVTFEAINQSMWTNGPEFTFGDNRFLGLNIEDSGSDGGLISTNWSYDIKAGLQSDLSIEGGNINSEIPWQLDFQTSFNRTTDVLTLNTSAMLLAGGWFDTDGPSLDYTLDFIFEYDIYAAVNVYADFYLATLDERLFTVNIDKEFSQNIVEYHSDTSDGLSYDFPYGITATLDWPNLEVDGNETSTTGVYYGDGASNNALDINLDIDQALADIFLGGENPFDLTADLTVAGGSFSILDVDVNAGLNFLQYFTLQAGSLDATLVFEDGSEQDFTFGDELTFDFASTLDVDGDGNVEFDVVLDLMDSTLQNTTELGFNAGYNIDIGVGNWWYDFAVYDDSGSFRLLSSIGENFPIASVPVFEDEIVVGFGEEKIDIFA